MRRSAALGGMVLVGFLAACGGQAADPAVERSAGTAAANASQNLSAAQTAAARPAGSPLPATATARPTVSAAQQTAVAPTVEVRLTQLANLVSTANAQVNAKEYAAGLATADQILEILPNHEGVRAALPTVRALATADAQTRARAEATAAAGPGIGRPYASGNWEYTVHGIQRAKELVASQFSKEVAKGEWVVVGVTVKNIARQNFGLNSHDFKLHDAAGTAYSTASVLGLSSWAKANGFHDAIAFSGTGQMPPQVALKYAVIFDVTPGAAGLRIELVQAKTALPLG